MVGVVVVVGLEVTVDVGVVVLCVVHSSTIMIKMAHGVAGSSS